MIPSTMKISPIPVDSLKRLYKMTLRCILRSEKIMNDTFQRNIVYSPCIDAICCHRPAFDPLSPIVAEKMKIDFQIFCKQFAPKIMFIQKSATLRCKALQCTAEYNYYRKLF